MGTIVGSLVTGIAAVPTTGLGLLAGAATGAIHGPWLKLVKETVEEDDGDGESGEAREEVN